MATLIPQLGLGVWQADNDQVIKAVHHAFDTGYRLIDTAAIYHNEEGVGKALKQSTIPRDELFITTNYGTTINPMLVVHYLKALSDYNLIMLISI